jgi:hypothetical protein
MNEKVKRGYCREDFADAWARYLSPETSENPSPTSVPLDSKRYSATTRINTSENGDFRSATAEPCSGSQNAVSANKDAPCSVVADHKEGEEGKQAKGQAQKVEVEWEA